MIRRKRNGRHIIKLSNKIATGEGRMLSPISHSVGDHMSKKACISLTIVLSIFMAGMLWKVHEKEETHNRLFQQIEIETRSLRLELYQAELELANQRKKFERQKKGNSTINFLFTDAGESVYTEAAPLMEEYGFCGIIVLSEQELPGRSGYLTIRQFQELLDEGWSWCIGVQEDEAQPKASCQRVAQWAKSNGIQAAEGVYFPDGTWTESCDEWMKDQDIKIAVMEQEKDVVVTETEAEIWHVKLLDWRNEYRREKLEQAVADGGNLVYSIQYGKNTLGSDKEYLLSMIQRIDSYCQSDHAQVATLTEACEYRKSVESGRDQAETLWAKEKEELERKIEKLNEEIDAVYARYSDQGK